MTGLQERMLDRADRFDQVLLKNRFTRINKRVDQALLTVRFDRVETLEIRAARARYDFARQEVVVRLRQLGEFEKKTQQDPTLTEKERERRTDIEDRLARRHAAQVLRPAAMAYAKALMAAMGNKKAPIKSDVATKHFATLFRLDVEGVLTTDSPVLAPEFWSTVMDDLAYQILPRCMAADRAALDLAAVILATAGAFGAEHAPNIEKLDQFFCDNQ